MKHIALLPLLCLLLVPASAAPQPTAPNTPLIRLTGSGWEAGFRNGVLVSLRNRLCGETFAVPSAPAPLTGVRRGSETVLATEGAETNARLTVSTKRLDAAWTGGVQLTQTTAAAGDFLALNQEVTALTPPLVGVQWGLASIPRDVTVLVPGHSGLAFGPGTPDGVWRFDYPSSWEAQFVLLQGKQGGFLISARDTVPLFKRLTVRRNAGVTSLEFETQATAPFEAVRAVRSVTWNIRPYRGSWQVGARLYREWAERAFGLAAIRATRPRWAAKIRCVCTVPMETQLLDELARRLNPAQTLLYIPSWRRDGYDRNYPDYTALPEFGAWLTHAHALGFRVMAHVNYFGCDPLNPLYQQFKSQQLRDPFSKEPLWWDWNRATPPIKFAYINPASRAWRQLFVSRMKEFCTRYPVDALHLDQTLCMYNDHNGTLDGMNS
ncbi:MAG TPA: DUF6259 domain-containing protein, partial [Armatimonadota bacterium]|nr:DUF6259 domain-containing protein [Armatimonadota bacterium]